MSKNAAIDKSEGPDDFRNDLGAAQSVAKNSGNVGSGENTSPQSSSQALQPPRGKVTFGLIVLDRDRYTVRVAERAVTLTRIEFDLLEFLGNHSNRVVSHAEIMRNIIGRYTDNGDSLIRVHVTHLRRKLGSASTMIQTVRGRGFILETDQAQIAASLK